MDNQNQNTAPQKSIEQIQAEQELNLHIPNEGAESNGQAQNNEPKYDDNKAQTGLYGLLSLIPIGLNIAGLPRTASVWGDDACRSVSAAFIPVFRKYAWGQNVIVFLEGGGGMEELALAAVLAPFVVATYTEYSQETENQRQASKEKEVKEAASNEPQN